MSAPAKDGLQFQDSCLDSLLTCQERFIADNPKVARFVEAYRNSGVAEPRFFEGSGGGSV